MESNSSMRWVSLPLAKRIIYAMSVTCIAASAVLFALTFSLDEYRGISWPAVVLLGLLAVLCDQVNLRFVIRRQTSSFNLGEIPLVLSLFWLPPLAFLLLRELPGQLWALVRTRSEPIKQLTNFAVHALDVALVSYLFRSVDARDPTQAKTWVVVLVAVLITNGVTSVVIGSAISLVQEPLRSRELLRYGVTYFGAALLNTSIGLVMALVFDVNHVAIALLAVIFTVMLFGYGAYSRVVRQHKTLNHLYDFTKAVSSARHDGGLADALLLRARELLDAERATLWLPKQGSYPELRLSAQEGLAGLIDDPHVAADAISSRVIDSGVTVVISGRYPTADPGLRAALTQRGIKDIIAVPLRSGSAIIGCLEAMNRMGDLSTFGADDVQLAETLAAHAAVAVENSRLVDRLRHDAEHDALTGLANRRRFASAVAAAIQVQPAPGEVVAIIEFDVDSLRDVNETLGHDAGDRLLVEVGRRLESESPDGALVARLGGDEFTVLVRAQGIEGAQARAAALQHGLVEPLKLDKFTLDVGAAVGIAVYPEHGDDAATLLQRADVATYAAKNNPRSIQVYRPALESRSLQRLGLISELRRAIDDAALAVFYQPKVALGNRELVGMECLVRWDHPEHGLVPPDEFIPVAEHTGLVGALTRLVLRTSLEQCRAWVDAGTDIGVAVNLSARSLADPDFAEELDAMLRETGVAPQRLTLEIVESAMVGDVHRPNPTLRKLFALGVRLSVDDFGTGYSSLSYLRRLPVHEVKIDKSFVLGMATDSGDLGIVRAIVDLGRHLGMAVVAEGVESEMTLALLEEMGCDIAQGFLFSRPLPAERIEAWMRQRTQTDTGTAVDGAQRLRVVSA